MKIYNCNGLVYQFPTSNNKEGYIKVTLSDNKEIMLPIENDYYEHKEISLYGGYILDIFITNQYMIIIENNSKKVTIYGCISKNIKKIEK